MIIRKIRFAAAIALLLAILTLSGATLAQSGGGYDLTWWTTDGGSGTVSGGGYLLQGTAGQPDAGAPATAGGYTLASGFWTGGASICPDTYEPNETFGAAKPIPTGSAIQAYICDASDDDWFQFGVVAGQTITVDLTTLPADYDLDLYDPSQGAAGSSANGGTTAEHISHTATASGAYRVYVFGYNGTHDATSPYTLRVQLSGGPAPKKLYTPIILRRR